jgi:hypothetical protein
MPSKDEPYKNLPQDLPAILHSTCIYRPCFTPSKDTPLPGVFLDTGGYFTPTTRRHMETALNSRLPGAWTVSFTKSRFTVHHDNIQLASIAQDEGNVMFIPRSVWEG